MSLKCGIVGLPNVGKSTLFNALTKAGIAAENYPFCTIEPNVGIVEVPDPRLAALAAIAKPERVLPADGRVRRHRRARRRRVEGRGAGQQVPRQHPRDRRDRARRALLRGRQRGPRRPAGVDPVSDIETINTELALADLAAVEKQIAKVEKARARAGDKDAQRILAALKKVEAVLDAGRPARTADLYHEELEVLAPFFLLTMKPTMYVANVAEHGFHDNPLLAAVEAHAAKEGAPVVSVCAAMEAEIADLSGEDKRVFLEDMGLTEPGLDRVIHAGYKLLGLRDVLHLRSEGSPRLDDPPRRHRAAGRRRHPHRLREGLHPGRSHRLRRLRRLQGRARRQGDRARCGSKARSTWCKDGDVMHFRFNV